MHASTTLFLAALVGSATANPISTSGPSNSTTSSTVYTQPIANATTSTPSPIQSTDPTHTGGSWLTTIYPTTVVTTSTRFIPCSTPVATSAGITYYSTWLTPTFIPTSYVSTCTESYAVANPTTTPMAPVFPVTSPPADCKSCYEVHTLTLTNGQTSAITLTDTQSTHEPTTTFEPTKPTGTGSTPTGTGSSAQGTGNVKWRRANVTPRAW